MSNTIYVVYKETGDYYENYPQPLGFFSTYENAALYANSACQEDIRYGYISIESESLDVFSDHKLGGPVELLDVPTDRLLTREECGWVPPRRYTEAELETLAQERQERLAKGEGTLEDCLWMTYQPMVSDQIRNANPLSWPTDQGEDNDS